VAISNFEKPNGVSDELKFNKTWERTSRGRTGDTEGCYSYFRLYDLWVPRTLFASVRGAWRTSGGRSCSGKLMRR